MVIIVLLALLALLSVGVFVVIGPINKFIQNNYTEEHAFHVSRLWTAVPVLILVLVWVFSSMAQIQSKELGVVTAFGQPVAEVGPGLHMTWPWEDVTKVDETIFSDTYADGTAIPVRLGDGNTATVSATIRWHVDPAAADYIYKNYRSNNPAESLRDSVVDTQFKAAVNEVSSQFNPTANIKTALAGGTLNFSPNYIALSQQITASMLGRVKDADGTSLVILDGVTVAGIKYNQSTEDRINSIVAQVAKTQQAVQAEQTAKAQAAANNILAASLNQNSYVLVSKCLDELAAGSFVAPAGFSCWPGQSGSVVIPGK